MYETGGGKAYTNVSKGDELLLAVINKKQFMIFKIHEIAID